jgi:hypothetical protein
VEVRKGVISLAKWKKVLKTGLLHYKRRCPNIRYIEVLNESVFKHFGGVKPAEYYDFYRAAYEAVNEVNDELRPVIQLRVGGNAYHHPSGVASLIKSYAADRSPRKRLDFLSFHEYRAGRTPSAAGRWERDVSRLLRKAGLDANIPMFVTEIAYAHVKPDGILNLHQAAGMTALYYHARHSRNLRLFPWVLYHTPAQQSVVQFDTRRRMTPFGAAVKMLTLHRKREVAATSSGLDKSGMGLGALATVDRAGVTVHLWNYQDRPATAEVAVGNMPEALRSAKLRIRRYLIDSEHSNCFASRDAPGGLHMVEQTRQTGAAAMRFSARLEPMALCLWSICCLDATDGAALWRIPASCHRGITVSGDLLAYRESIAPPDGSERDPQRAKDPQRLVQDPRRDHPERGDPQGGTMSGALPTPRKDDACRFRDR